MIALRILIVAALQTAALVYMIGERQAMLNASRVVTLKTMPVDPSDPFRGEYVVLTYTITQLDLAKLDGENDLNQGDTVYVTVRKHNGEWGATAIGKTRTPSTPDAVVIKGTVHSAYRPKPSEPPPQVRVDYGIESYWVPQGTGREIETEFRAGDLTVDVAVDDAGRPAIKALRRKGKVFYVEGIF
jgi:uncharacterized membrane-anchored protein